MRGDYDADHGGNQGWRVTRDPVTDPAKGDVLRQGKMTLRVLEVDRRVHYEITHVGGRGIDAIPVQGMQSRAGWRTLAEGYDVVEAK